MSIFPEECLVQVHKVCKSSSDGKVILHKSLEVGLEV